MDKAVGKTLIDVDEVCLLCSDCKTSENGAFMLEKAANTRKIL